MSTAVNGFILAGGKSDRMGQDKALLNWHGQTLLEHIVTVVSRAADQVQVVGRDSLPDRLPGLGPLSGIATALESSETDANLMVAVDLPFLTVDFVKYFRSRLEISNCRVLVCRIRSRFPLCLGIRQAILPELQRRLDDRNLSVHGFIESSTAEVIAEAEVIDAGFDPSIFQNINTYEEYRAALSASSAEKRGQ